MKALVLILLFLTSQITFSQNLITLKSQRNIDNSVDIEYFKNKPGSYRVYLNFTAYENTLTPQRKFTIKNSTGFLMKLSPINGNNYIKYSYTYSYRRGVSNSKVDSSFVYLLPFKNNTTVEVRYLNNLSTEYFGKEEPETWKSFQFTSNNPDTVCAARKGIVVNIIDSFSIDTTHIYSFSSKRNSIMIEHPDGTFARYQGLNGENIFVKEGDVVLANQALGTLTRYDKKDKYQLRFAIDYLIEKPLENNEKFEKCSYEYIDPYFQTTEGIIKITAKHEFTSKVTEDIIIKELSKKEVKTRQKINK